MDDHVEMEVDESGMLEVEVIPECESSGVDEECGGRAVLTFLGNSRGYCGYCRRSGGQQTLGLWAETMSAADYETLMYAGWRRSGRYLYYPDWERTCCPQLAIRLDVLSFRPSKQQRRVMKRMQRFLAGSLSSSVQGTGSSKGVLASSSPGKGRDGGVSKDSVAEGRARKLVNEVVNHAVELLFRGDHHCNVKKSSLHKLSVFPTKSRFQDPCPNKVPHHCHSLTSNVAFLLAGATAHHTVSGTEVREKQQLHLANEVKNKVLELRPDGICLVKSRSPGYLNFRVCTIPDCSTETRVDTSNSDDATDPPRARQMRETRCKLKMSLEPASFSMESFIIFQKYQCMVHDEPPQSITVASYTDFLVDSPIRRESLPESSPGRYGSFHLKYSLDDKLIAVSVIDILPTGVSSVYHFHDPEYRFLAPGVHSALQEIDWIRSLLSVHNDMQFLYYYLGYIVPGNPKMMYKADFLPSEIRCPVTGDWVDGTLAMTMIDTNQGRPRRFYQPDQKTVFTSAPALRVSQGFRDVRKTDRARIDYLLGTLNSVVLSCEESGGVVVVI